MKRSGNEGEESDNAAGSSNQQKPASSRRRKSSDDDGRNQRNVQSQPNVSRGQEPKPASRTSSHIEGQDYKSKKVDDFMPSLIIPGVKFPPAFSTKEPGSSNEAPRRRSSSEERKQLQTSAELLKSPRQRRQTVIASTPAKLGEMEADRFRAVTFGPADTNKTNIKAKITLLTKPALKDTSKPTGSDTGKASSGVDESKPFSDAKYKQSPSDLDKSRPGSDGRGGPGTDGRGMPSADGRGTPSADGRGTPSADGRGAPSADGRGTPSADGKGRSSADDAKRRPSADAGDGTSRGDDARKKRPSAEAGDGTPRGDDTRKRRPSSDAGKERPRADDRGKRKPSSEAETGRTDTVPGTRQVGPDVDRPATTPLLGTDGSEDPASKMGKQIPQSGVPATGKKERPSVDSSRPTPPSDVKGNGEPHGAEAPPGSKLDDPKSPARTEQPEPGASSAVAKEQPKMGTGESPQEGPPTQILMSPKRRKELPQIVRRGPGGRVIIETQPQEPIVIHSGTAVAVDTYEPKDTNKSNIKVQIAIAKPKAPPVETLHPPPPPPPPKPKPPPPKKLPPPPPPPSPPKEEKPPTPPKPEPPVAELEPEYERPRNLSNAIIEYLNTMAELSAEELERDEIPSPEFADDNIDVIQLLKKFNIPDQQRALESLLDTDSVHFDFGGLLRQYYSYVLRSYCPINMQDRYRGVPQPANCFTSIDLSRVGTKEEEMDKVTKAKLKKLDEKREQLRNVAVDEDHFNYLKNLANDQATLLPLTIVHMLNDQMAPILEDIFRFYGKNLGTEHKSTKEAGFHYMKIRKRCEMYAHICGGSTINEDLSVYFK